MGSVVAASVEEQPKKNEIKLNELDEVREKLTTRVEYGNTSLPETITDCNFVNYTHFDIQGSFYQESNTPLIYKVFPSLDVFNTSIDQCNVGTQTSGKGFWSLINNSRLLRLDYRKIPNIANIDPRIRTAWRQSDPEGYGVPFSFGPMVIAVKTKIVSEIFGSKKTPKNATFYLNPDNLKKIKAAGYKIVTTLEAGDVMPPVYITLGLDPNSSSPKDLATVAKQLQAVKPFIDGAVSGSEIASMMDEKVVLGLFMYDGDMEQARLRLQKKGDDQGLIYFIPNEGGYVWLDFKVIPSHNKHLDNIYAYINHLLKPENAKLFTQGSQFSNTVVGVPDITLFTAKPLAEETIQARQRIWDQFMRGIPEEKW